jgi:hypothetical protein
MSQYPVKASRADGPRSEPAPAKLSPRSDRWRARIGIALGGALGLLAIAHAEGWLPLSGGVVWVVALFVSQLQWVNLGVARADSAFRRDGHPLRRDPPAPGQPPRRLSPHTRGKLVYVIEAFVALGTSLAALIIGAHLLTPDPHPMIYLATASLFTACALAILFPKLGAR